MLLFRKTSPFVLSFSFRNTRQFDLNKDANFKLCPDTSKVIIGLLNELLIKTLRSALNMSQICEQPLE